MVFQIEDFVELLIFVKREWEMVVDGSDESVIKELMFVSGFMLCF